MDHQDRVLSLLSQVTNCITPCESQPFGLANSHPALKISSVHVKLLPSSRTLQQKELQHGQSTRRNFLAEALVSLNWRLCPREQSQSRKSKSRRKVQKVNHTAEKHRLSDRFFPQRGAKCRERKMSREETCCPRSARTSKGLTPAAPRQNSVEPLRGQTSPPV